MKIAFNGHSPTERETELTQEELTQYGKEKIRELMSKSTENPDEIVLEDVKMFHLESMNERNA